MSISPVGSSGLSPHALAPNQLHPPGGQGFSQKRFDRIDTDQDGSVTLSELQAFQQQQQAAGKKTPAINKFIHEFTQLDTDNSGSLTLAEIHAGAASSAAVNVLA